MDPVENRDYCQTYCGRGDNHRLLSTEAAGKALKNAEISAEDVDIIIAATVSADKHLPGLACEVQKNIGAENAVAFDINAACSGFLVCTGYCGAVFRTWRISACACDWSGNAVKNDGLDGPEHLRAFWGRRRGSGVFHVSKERWHFIHGAGFGWCSGAMS